MKPSHEHDTVPIRRVGELIADLAAQLLHELQTDDHPRSMHGRRQRPVVPFVDVSGFPAEMSDRKVARALGAPPSKGDYYDSAVADERSGVNDRRLEGRPRCEAGRTTQLNLRCLRPAAEGSRWCRLHVAPEPTGNPDRPDRLTQWQLFSRQDGRMLEMLYALADSEDRLMERQHELLDALSSVERRLQSIEDGLLRIPQAAPAPAPWIDTLAAAAYTGRSRRAIYQAVEAGALRVSRSSSQGRMSFQVADLDAWMEAGRRAGRARRGR